MIKQFLKQYRIFKHADFSFKNSVIYTLRSMNIVISCDRLNQKYRGK